MVPKMEFVTLPQAGRLGFVKEWRLREMLKQGILDNFGYFAGNRFYLNITAFTEWLQEQTSGKAGN